jgi:hypothetical protein
MDTPGIRGIKRVSEVSSRVALGRCYLRVRPVYQTCCRRNRVLIAPVHALAMKSCHPDKVLAPNVLDLCPIVSRLARARAHSPSLTCS